MQSFTAYKMAGNTALESAAFMEGAYPTPIYHPILNSQNYALYFFFGVLTISVIYLLFSYFRTKRN